MQLFFMLFIKPLIRTAFFFFFQVEMILLMPPFATIFLCSLLSSWDLDANA